MGAILSPRGGDGGISGGYNPFTSREISRGGYGGDGGWGGYSEGNISATLTQGSTTIAMEVGRAGSGGRGGATQSGVSFEGDNGEDGGAGLDGWITLTPLAPAAIARPTNLRTEALSTSYQVHIRWDAVTGAVGYEYRVRQSGTSVWPGWTDNGNNTNVALGSLTPGTSYQIQVRAEGLGSRYSAESSTHNFTVPAVPVATGQTVASTTTSITATWTGLPILSSARPNQAVHYRFREQGASTWGDWIATDIAFGSGHAALIEDLTPATNYEIQVRFTDRAGNIGAISSTFTASTSALRSVFASTTPVSNSSGVFWRRSATATTNGGRLAIVDNTSTNPIHRTRTRIPATLMTVTAARFFTRFYMSASNGRTTISIANSATAGSQAAGDDFTSAWEADLRFALKYKTLTCVFRIQSDFTEPYLFTPSGDQASDMIQFATQVLADGDFATEPVIFALLDGSDDSPVDFDTLTI